VVNIDFCDRVLIVLTQIDFVMNDSLDYPEKTYQEPAEAMAGNRIPAEAIAGGRTPAETIAKG